MTRVTLSFVGDTADTIAQRFYAWLMDGGLEDVVIDTLSDDEAVVGGICGHDNAALEVVIACASGAPADG